MNTEAVRLVLTKNESL